jgi:hypothetical protein
MWIENPCVKFCVWARFADGESLACHILALLWKLAAASEARRLRLQAPAGVTPHSYHGMFPLYSLLLSIACEIGTLSPKMELKTV